MTGCGIRRRTTAAVAAPDPESAEQPQVLVGEVVPFALFDPFADDLEAGR